MLERWLSDRPLLAAVGRCVAACFVLGFREQASRENRSESSVGNVNSGHAGGGLARQRGGGNAARLFGGGARSWAAAWWEIEQRAANSEKHPTATTATRKRIRTVTCAA